MMMCHDTILSEKILHEKSIQKTIQMINMAWYAFN